MTNASMNSAQFNEPGAEELDPPAEITRCPWCGRFGPDFDQNELPPDYCNHDLTLAVERPE